MSDLIAADLLKLRRRSGLWFSVLLIPTSFVVLLTVLTATAVVETDGGAAYLDDLSQALNLFVTLLAVLVGARLGSEERATGTLRYQLLTGTPRHLLYLSKIATMALACVAMTLAAAALATIGSFVVPLGDGDTTGVGDVLSAVWAVLLPGLVYGSIAFGVGALMGSTGPAITVALVLNLVGIDLLYALTLIDDWFRHLVLDLGVDRLTVDEADEDSRVGVAAAIAMVVAWVGGFLGAGWLRIRSIEA